MALVTGYTAERMQQIEDQTVIDGNIVGDDLVLVTRDGTEINAGVVKGDQGDPGTNGTNGATGAQGIAGPTKMIGLPNGITTGVAQMGSSGDISLSRNNVPVVAGRTYGINIQLMLVWDSLQANARWDIWCRINGANHQRFQACSPGYGGSTFVQVRGQVFWTPGVTQSTDDITTYAENVVSGALITPSGSGTLVRDLWIIDYGVLP